MKKDKLLSSSLSDLLEKYFKQDVIAEMEKRYQSAPARLIPITEIDDTETIKQVAIPESTIEYFASGLRERGFYNPCGVRKKEDGRYEIVLGRKRFYGALRAGIISIPCVLIECSEEEELLMLLADTRDQREGNVVEMALVCQELKTRYGYTQKTLAELSHQSRCQIANTLRILNLPKDALNKISLGELSYGHARAIASLPADEMEAMIKEIARKSLSVRETENLVRERNKFGHQDVCIKEAEERTGGKIVARKKGISIEFASEREKEEFLRKIAEIY